MKYCSLTGSILLMIFTSACGGRSQQEHSNTASNKKSAPAVTHFVRDSFPSGKVLQHVICRADSGQSYALYIPTSGNAVPLPVVYFFDPHGDGALPLEKYKDLAEKYNFLFVGSNNSKNGNDLAMADSIWNILSQDVTSRLDINTNRIYVCGFSGGAKVASYLALEHNSIKGVIANGAGLSEMLAGGNLPFSFTAIAGEGDMNMTDLVAIDVALDKTTTRHRIIFFDGIHEWAPERVMNIAFEGLQFDAMFNKIIPVNNQLIDEYLAESNKRIEHYLVAKNYISAIEECRLAANLLTGITTQVNQILAQEASIEKNPAYQAQLQERQKLLATEERIKNIFNQEFQAGDMNYWKKTIHEVQEKAKEKSDEGAMYQRLQAYLSLAFYTISNQLISGNRDEDAAYFVDLYKMADPTNSEAWYFSAILDARKNNIAATTSDLLKAVQNGFKDKARLEGQPEFQKPVSHLDLKKIEDRIK
jgi:hypothetical protein